MDREGILPHCEYLLSVAEANRNDQSAWQDRAKKITGDNTHITRNQADGPKAEFEENGKFDRGAAP
jgi:hypothetical protein